MTQYAEVDRATSTILRYSELDNPKLALNKKRVWLLVRRDPAPDYNPVTHKMEKTRVVPDLSDLNVDVPADTEIVDEYTITQKTATELDENLAAPHDLTTLVNTLVSAPVLKSTDFPSELIDRVNARNRLDGKPEI
jgi:hypothetical protein